MKRAVCGIVLAFAPALAGTVVFERVEPVEVRTGVMRLKTVQAPLLEVPDLEARDPIPWREQRFQRLYAIEFGLETKRRDRAAAVDDRGTLLVAVQAKPDDLVALDERIRAHLASLGPDAFALPLTGFYEGQPPLDGLIAITVGPSFTCTVRPGRKTAGIYQRTADSAGITGFSTGDIPERLCPELLGAVAGSAAEETRTLSGPREIHEIVVELEVSNTLPEEVLLDDLPGLPSGVTWTKRSKEGGGYSVESGEAGTIPRATFFFGGMEWDASTVPSSLSPDLLSRGAYVSRWTLRTLERRVGVEPKREVGMAGVLTLALLLVPPPALEGEKSPSKASLPVRFDADAFRAEVARRLDAGSALDAATLESALTVEPKGLDSDGFLLVVCRGDGSAWFGLPPTRTHSPVTNASLICAAMDRMLP
jgi:hypothetical protein